jgi:hypothetical protein
MRSAMGIPDCAFLPDQGRTRRVVLLLAPGQQQQGVGRVTAGRIARRAGRRGSRQDFRLRRQQGGAFTFAADATSFRADSGSRGSLGDLKIVPGRAVVLAANAVSTQTVN